MTKTEAKRLKVSDRVIIFAETDSRCTGSVIETGFNAVKFEWDDGQIGVIHLSDMQDVHRFNSAEKLLPAITA